MYSLENPNFTKSAMKIARSARIVEKDMLEEQFYKFTQRLESVTNHQSIDNLYKSDS